MLNERLRKQIEFILEVDKLKRVYRQALVLDKSRNENSAEHSWHLALMAVVLSEHSNEKNLDLHRVIKMLLIHDLVEIDAGDTFAYDDKGYESKLEREQQAANRLFNILPSDQAQEIFELWQEFEERQTPEAKFANAMDRLQPMLHNYHTEGAAWQKHGITSDKVRKRNETMAEGSNDLWNFAQELIESALKQGYLKA